MIRVQNEMIQEDLYKTINYDSSLSLVHHGNNAFIGRCISIRGNNKKALWLIIGGYLTSPELDEVLPIEKNTHSYEFRIERYVDVDIKIDNRHANLI